MKVLDLISATLPSEEDIEREVMMAEMARKLHTLLSKLTIREERLIRSRYFLDKTRNEVGEEFGLSNSRIAQIENEAIRKLRKASRRAGLFI